MRQLESPVERSLVQCLYMPDFASNKTCPVQGKKAGQLRDALPAWNSFLFLLLCHEATLVGAAFWDIAWHSILVIFPITYATFWILVPWQSWWRAMQWLLGSHECSQMVEMICMAHTCLYDCFCLQSIALIKTRMDAKVSKRWIAMAIQSLVEGPHCCHILMQNL